MARLFSPRARHTAWRDLWICLAESEEKLGFPVTKEQIAELRKHRDTFDWDRVAELEKELRHDVMAHVHHFGELAPSAKPIIHLGATSCFVTDNAHLVIYRQAMGLIARRLGAVMANLAEFAKQWRSQPCLGYTHFQVAQPVTVGKRACLWAQDFALDFDEILRVIDALQLADTRKVATPADWRPGGKVIIPPSISNDEAKGIFPQGWEEIRPYLRVTDVN